MPARIPIPRELSSTPFTIEDGIAAGLGRGRMRGADLARPFRGVRTVGDPDGFLDRCRAYAPRLRQGEYFSHSTATALWGCPMPYFIDDGHSTTSPKMDGAVRVRKRGIFTDPMDTVRRVGTALRAHGWRPGGS